MNRYKALGVNFVDNERLILPNSSLSITFMNFYKMETYSNSISIWRRRRASAVIEILLLLYDRWWDLSFQKTEAQVLGHDRAQLIKEPENCKSRGLLLMGSQNFQMRGVLN